MLNFTSNLSWGIDCPAADVGRLPASVRAAVPAIWPYVTGTPEICWSDAQIALFPKARIFRVNQHHANANPMDGDEFDIEAMAWTPGDCVDIARARRSHQWSTRFYGTYGVYQIVAPELAAAGVRKSTFWRIADWNLDKHLATEELWGDVYAGQWASPSSNPSTLIPGTSITLAEANADLNVLLLENTGWEG